MSFYHLKLEHLPSGKVYISKSMDFSDEKDLRDVAEICEKINVIEYLTFESKEETYYFPASVLKQSVLSIVIHRLYGEEE